MVNQDTRAGFADTWSSDNNDVKFFYGDPSSAMIQDRITTTTTLGPCDPEAGLVCGLSSPFTALAGGPQESFTTTSSCLQDHLSLQEDTLWRTFIETKADGEHEICSRNGETRIALLQGKENVASTHGYQEVLSHLLQPLRSSSSTGAATGEWGFSLFSPPTAVSQERDDNHHRESPKQHQRHQLEESSLLQELNIMLLPTSSEARQTHGGLLLPTLSEPMPTSSLVAGLLQGGEQSHGSSSQTVSSSPRPPPGFSTSSGQHSQILSRVSLESHGSHHQRGDSGSDASFGLLSCSSAESVNTCVDSRSSVPDGGVVRTANTCGRTRVTSMMRDSLPSRRKVLFERRDDKSLSPFQCLLRRQIELFEADQRDVDGINQLRKNQRRRGRQDMKKQIIVGQVGIRCIHCGSQAMSIPGAVLFPTLQSTYRASKTMADRHLMHNCTNIPEFTRQELIRVHLLENSTDSSVRLGGACDWASALQAAGVVQTAEKRLLFDDRQNISSPPSPARPAVGEWGCSVLLSESGTCQAKQDEQYRHRVPKRLGGHKQVDSVLLQDLSILSPATSIEALQHQNKLLLALLAEKLQSSLSLSDLLHGGHNAGQPSCHVTTPPGLSTLLGTCSQKSPRSVHPSYSSLSSDVQSCSSAESTEADSCSCTSNDAGAVRSTAAAAKITTEVAILCDKPPPRRNILFELRDEKVLSPYQCLLRRQIELFEADKNDVDGINQLRNQQRHGRPDWKKQIIVGQVGIRCIHCGTHSMRTQGAVYFPTLHSTYRASKTMADRHFMHKCTNIPEFTRQELIRVHLLENSKDSSLRVGGARHWASALQAVGIVQTGVEKRLLFDDRFDIPSQQKEFTIECDRAGLRL